jgi:hypothetical protein
MQGAGSFKRAKTYEGTIFWLKDLIDQEIIGVIRTLTEEFVANILTKPVVGWKFQCLSFELIGWNNIVVMERNNNGHFIEEV